LGRYVSYFPRRSRQRRHRSAAAARQVGKSNKKPDWRKWPGTTRRLLRISSVSVRRKKAPISSIHLWFDRPITQLRHAVLVGRLSQWMFNRSAIHEGDSSVNSAAPSKGPPTPPLRMGGDDAGRFEKSKIQNPKSKIFYYQVVISASREVLDRRNDETIRDVLEELSNIWPIVREARLIHARLVTEHKAVISMLPEVDRLRPVQQTPIGNLQLAGDWTQTGWPGTMEGAVRSGYLAAQNVLRQCGRDETLVQPDLPRAPLSKLLFGL